MPQFDQHALGVLVIITAFVFVFFYFLSTKELQPFLKMTLAMRERLKKKILKFDSDIQNASRLGVNAENVSEEILDEMTKAARREAKK